MFFHEFVYELKRVVRQKEELFWVLLFPMILGTMFYVAFGNLNNTTENFHTIPVAVCIEDEAAGKPFLEVMDALSEDGDTPLVSVTETDWEDAMKRLEEDEVRGIFQVGEEVTLSCAQAQNNNANATLSIEQSILEAVLREYKANMAAILEIMEKKPEKLTEAVSLISSQASYGKELSLTPGNMDAIIQYYFNLIAMACLFTSFAGAFVAINNQANLSALGARKCVSPMGKFLSVTAQLLSCLLVQFISVAVNVLYLFYVIKVDFGTALPNLLFTSFIVCIMGVSFGFFIGCIGRLSENVKMGIMIASSMLCCFLSGLMIGNMRVVIEDFCPFINDVNPAVLISDSFLTLNIYGFGERYGANLAFLLLFAVFFVTAGCLMIRRKNYASL